MPVLNRGGATDAPRETRKKCFFVMHIMCSARHLGTKNFLRVDPSANVSTSDDSTLNASLTTPRHQDAVACTIVEIDVVNVRVICVNEHQKTRPAKTPRRRKILASSGSSQERNTGRQELRVGANSKFPPSPRTCSSVRPHATFPRRVGDDVEMLKFFAISVRVGNYGGTE